MTPADQLVAQVGELEAAWPAQAACMGAVAGDGACRGGGRNRHRAGDFRSLHGYVILRVMPYPIGKAFLTRLALDFEVPPTSQVDGRSARREHLLGTSLSYLYQIATCYPSCHGGDHVLESLVGRCFNHSLGSARLIELNLYDESLNLTRSIAEITNLMFLFHASAPTFNTWKAATRKERLSEFSPAAVRKKLENNGWPNPSVSESAYRELCELATHVTPETRPNRHDENLDIVGFVGGVFEATGHKKAVNTLLLYSSLSCLVASDVFGMRERVLELAEIGKNTFYDE